MTRSLSREELAWSAGFFDGEGCTYRSRHHHGNRYRVTIQVNQAETSTLIRFKTAVLDLGNIDSHPAIRPNCKPRWAWRATNFEHAQAVIALLWNWLSSPKREQARRHLLFLKNQPSKISKQEHSRRVWEGRRRLYGQTGRKPEGPQA